eukprot:1158420-Pelagomonas_calceolata.AAC.2
MSSRQMNCPKHQNAHKFNPGMDTSKRIKYLVATTEGLEHPLRHVLYSRVCSTAASFAAASTLLAACAGATAAATAAAGI